MKTIKFKGKKLISSIISFIVTLMLLITATPGISAYALTNPVKKASVPAKVIKVIVDGKAIKFTDAVPFIQKGVTFVPVRFVSEALGCKVDWENTKKLVVVTRTRDKMRIVMQVGSRDVIVNSPEGDVRKTLPAAVQTCGVRTFVPLRFVSETLGASVSWDDKIYGVQIKSNGGITSVPADSSVMPTPAPSDGNTGSNENSNANDTTKSKVAEYKSLDELPEGYWNMDDLVYVVGFHVKDDPRFEKLVNIEGFRSASKDSDTYTFCYTERNPNNNNYENESMRITIMCDSDNIPAHFRIEHATLKNYETIEMFLNILLPKFEYKDEVYKMGLPYIGTPLKAIMKTMGKYTVFALPMTDTVWNGKENYGVDVFINIID